MMTEKNYLYCFIFIILISCQTVGDVFHRPKIDAMIANGDGTGYRNGELIEDTTNMMCITTGEYDVMYSFYDDPKRCR